MWGKNMFLFEKGIGKLKNLSRSELKTIMNNLPNGWGYSFEYAWKSPVDEEFDKFNVKLFRKKEL